MLKYMITHLMEPMLQPDNRGIIMPTEETLPKTIRYVYTKSDDHKVIYVNGIHGGVTMQSEVAFDLFLEQHNTTNVEVHRIEENGAIGASIRAEKEIGPQEQEEAIMIRERKIGIVLSRDAAENIANWILRKVKQIDSFKEQNATEEEQNAEE